MISLKAKWLPIFLCDIVRTCVKLFLRGANCSVLVPIKKIERRSAYYLQIITIRIAFELQPYSNASLQFSMGLYVKEAISSICLIPFVPSNLL